MQVINVGKDSVILTDYNGKRYAFHRQQPVEISEEIYKEIIRSGFVNSNDIKVLTSDKSLEDKKSEDIKVSSANNSKDDKSVKKQKNKR